MPKTVGIERASDKYVRRASVAGPDYQAGIQSPKRPWAAAAAGAKGTYQQAIAEPDVPERFARGIRRVGDAKWAKMAATKGTERFARGVELGQDDYRTSMASVLSTIEGVTLPSRGPRGSVSNYDRVKRIGDALHAKRVAKSVGGK